MATFDVWDHAENRAVSYYISSVLDATVGRAVRGLCSNYQVDEDETVRIATAITNGIHVGIDTAISYEVKGRQFRGWDVAFNFLTKQLVDETKDTINMHRQRMAKLGIHYAHHDDQWDRLLESLHHEAIAFLKAYLMPKPPMRPGFR